MVNIGLANFFDNLDHGIKRVEKIVVALVLLALTIAGGFMIIQHELPDSWGSLFSPKVKAESPPQPTPSSAPDPPKSTAAHKRRSRRNHSPLVAAPCACTCPAGVQSAVVPAVIDSVKPNIELKDELKNELNDKP